MDTIGEDCTCLILEYCDTGPARVCKAFHRLIARIHRERSLRTATGPLSPLRATIAAAPDSAVVTLSTYTREMHDAIASLRLAVDWLAREHGCRGINALFSVVWRIDDYIIYATSMREAVNRIECLQACPVDLNDPAGTFTYDLINSTRGMHNALKELMFLRDTIDLHHKRTVTDIGMYAYRADGTIVCEYSKFKFTVFIDDVIDKLHSLLFACPLVS